MKIPKVTDGCKEKGHRCMTCYEVQKYYIRKGLPKKYREQILKLLKMKSFTTQEFSEFFGFSPEIIQKTLDEMAKSGIIIKQEEKREET
jgi:DNA-binding HxlR family transcriptional regulator